MEKKECLKKSLYLNITDTRTYMYVIKDYNNVQKKNDSYMQQGLIIKKKPDLKHQNIICATHHSTEVDKVQGVTVGREVTGANIRCNINRIDNDLRLGKQG